MSDDALLLAADLLRCPHCGAAMTADARAVACANGHGFDRARGGGVTLLRGGAELPPGDTPDMLAAREAFLAAGHYDAITAALAQAAGGATWLVDAGAGTGQHTAGVLVALGSSAHGIALDASKTATRRAARAHPRLAAVACDVTGELPLRDDGADAVLSVFSPRNPAEFARVLAPWGRLVIASAADDHLHEAIAPLGLLTVQPEKRRKLHARLSPMFASEGAIAVRVAMALDHAALTALASMGPAAFHRTAEDLAARVAALPEPFPVTASVIVERFAPA